jgi:hypothetical protein
MSGRGRVIGRWRVRARARAREKEKDKEQKEEEEKEKEGEKLQAIIFLNCLGQKEKSARY